MSVGAFLSAQSSTYSNLRLSLTAAPALEYDLFPYSESTKRQLRVLYQIGITRARYHEETVYLKTAETLLQESLNIAYEVVRPWGKASIQIQGSHFFHGFSKNRVELEAELELRIWRGLSFEIDGSYARIRDQLALSAEGASLEEILLRQKQLATGYDYSFSVGFNFYFTLAMGMLLGSLIGIQVGALTTKVVKGIHIRGFYAMSIIAGFINRGSTLPKKLTELEVINVSKPVCTNIEFVGNIIFWIVVGFFGFWVMAKFFTNIKTLRAEA